MSLFEALYATGGQGSSLPSMFELLFADRMRASVRPAYEHLVLVLFQRLPNLLGPVMRWKDEVFALILFIVERYSLANNSASFSESFHGLQRKRVLPVHQPTTPLDTLSATTAELTTMLQRDQTSTPHAPQITNASPLDNSPVTKFGTRRVDFSPQADSAVSLFCLVVFPYLWHKLATNCARLTAEAEENAMFGSGSGSALSPRTSNTEEQTATEGSGAGADAQEGVSAIPWITRASKAVARVRAMSWRDIWERHGKVAFIKGFPVLDSIAGLLSLYFQIRYLLQRTEFASPWLKLCGLVLVRRPAPAESTASGASPSANGESALSLWRRIAGYGVLGAQFLFTASLMALKVFEWFTINNTNGELTRPNDAVGGSGRPSGGPTGGSTSGALRPPELLEVDVESSKSPTNSVSQNRSACPICNRDPVVNPTATYTGYVGCYTCIVPFVKENHKCPVSGMPCNADQVRKLIPF